MIKQCGNILKRNVILLDQGVISGVNFVNTILIAKYLGVFHFGIYAMCLLSVQFLGSIQQAFIIKPLFSLFPEESKRDINFLNKVGYIQLVFSGLSTIMFLILIWIISFFFEGFKSPTLIFTLSTYAGLVVFYDYLRRLFIIEKRLLKLLIIDIIVYCGFLFVNIFLIGYDLLSTQNILISNSIILLIFSTYIVTSSPYKWDKKKDIQNTFKSLWKYSKYLVFTSLLQWLSGNLFILFAGVLLGPVALGMVRLAQSIMGVFNVLFLALENIIPLKAAYVNQENRSKLIPFFRSQGIKYGIPVVLMVVTISLLGETIVNQIIGKSFGSYSYIIVSFSILYILIYINTLLQFFIRTIHANDIIFKSYLVSSVFALTFSKLMISSWGLVGVLLGLFITQILLSATNFVLIKRIY